MKHTPIVHINASMIPDAKELLQNGRNWFQKELQPMIHHENQDSLVEKNASCNHRQDFFFFNSCKIPNSLWEQKELVEMTPEEALALFDKHKENEYESLSPEILAKLAQEEMEEEYTSLSEEESEKILQYKKERMKQIQWKIPIWEEKKFFSVQEEELEAFTPEEAEQFFSRQSKEEKK